jgi:hypothetical protein
MKTDLNAGQEWIPAGIDEDGNLFVIDATQFPQYAPGVKKSPELGNSAGLLPCNHVKRCHASSCSPGRDGLYCIDNSTITWWQPADDDPMPTMTFPLVGEFHISAIRLWWRDIGLDYDNGILPGPFKFKIEGSLEDDDWFTIVDKTQNEVDMHIDFLTFDTVEADQVRIVITGWAKGITPALIDATIFGVRNVKVR